MTLSIISMATSCDEMGVLTSQDSCNKNADGLRDRKFPYDLEQIAGDLDLSFLISEIEKGTWHSFDGVQRGLCWASTPVGTHASVITHC